MKAVCAKHEQAYEVGEGCPWCEPEPWEDAVFASIGMVPVRNAAVGERVWVPVDTGIKLIASDAVPVGQAYVLAAHWSPTSDELSACVMRYKLPD